MSHWFFPCSYGFIAAISSFEMKLNKNVQCLSLCWRQNLVLSCSCVLVARQPLLTWISVFKQGLSHKNLDTHLGKLGNPAVQSPNLHLEAISQGNTTRLPLGVGKVENWVGGKWGGSCAFRVSILRENLIIHHPRRNSRSPTTQPMQVLAFMTPSSESPGVIPTQKKKYMVYH